MVIEISEVVTAYDTDGISPSQLDFGKGARGAVTVSIVCTGSALSVTQTLGRHNNSRNSLFVMPASAIISISNPLPMGSCLGTEMRLPSSFRRMMWLPDCLTGLKPILPRALTIFNQDRLGSLEGAGNYKVTRISLAFFSLASASTSST